VGNGQTPVNQALEVQSVAGEDVAFGHAAVTFAGISASSRAETDPTQAGEITRAPPSLSKEWPGNRPLERNHLRKAGIT